MAKAKQARLHCTFCATAVVLPVNAIVIDDIDQVFRAQCPKCLNLIERDYTGETRQALRRVGVRTVEEIMQSETACLKTENSYDVWKAFYSAVSKV